MKKKVSDFFWPGFTDLMTSLFFIMLVLYVLTFTKLRLQQQTTERELNKIKNIEAAVRALPAKYFTYDSAYKRFELNRVILFSKGNSQINPADTSYLADVGRSIDSLVKRLETQYQSDKIKYLIVIEGMSSNDNYRLNDELSYQRSLSLFKLWQDEKIFFDPLICDLQIAGSGIRGVGRFPSSEEFRNQRFLIQILPKISI